MSLLKRIFAAVLNVAEEAAAHVVEEVKIAVQASIQEMRLPREEARRRGAQKLAAYAAVEGARWFDTNSIDDTFRLLKETVFVHDYAGRSVNDLKQELADELARAGADDLKDYRAGHATGPQNDKLRSELQIMVGYGDIVLER